MRGVVKFFNRSRGYGFIVADDGKKEYFVHHKDVWPHGTHLVEGLTVEFEPTVGERGLRAENVCIVVQPKERGRDGQAAAAEDKA